jgi:uncharacterized protein
VLRVTVWQHEVYSVSTMGLLQRADGSVLARDLRVAGSVLERIRGLLGERCLETDAGLLIEPARQIHTFGMRFAIDVVFLNAGGVVVHVVHGMRPWRLTRWVRAAKKAIELPQDATADVKIGERLTFT